MTMATKRAVTCGQGECFKRKNREEVKMHKPDNARRSNGWANRLKRSAGVKFKVMVIEEDMFLHVVMCI